MSLDVYLYDENGEELFWMNTTHNHGPIAREAGVYEAIWEPGACKASDISERIWIGIMLMAAEPERFKRLDAANGWGSWAHFLPWVCEYCSALRQYPNATVAVSR